MIRALSLALCAALMFGTVASPVFAASVCKGEKAAFRTASNKTKTANRNLSKAEKDVAKLERRVETALTSYERALANEESRILRKTEQLADRLDRQENRRAAYAAALTDLGTKIAACAASGWLNDIFGSDLVCNESTRSRLIAESAQLTVAIQRIETAIASMRSRNSRELESYTRSEKAKTAKKLAKLRRFEALLEKARLKVPALQAAASNAQSVSATAEDRLNACLAAN